MNEHRYILERYKGMNTRNHCPACNSKNKTFSLYIDTETGQHVHDSVGRCNRESNCGYHYTPKQYFRDNHISIDAIQMERVRLVPQPKPETSYIPNEIFKSSLTAYQSNNFIKRLLTLFGEEITGHLIAKYFIGSSKHWPGSTVFWQIDTKRKIRTGKIMLYDAITGKRMKEPLNYITWVHSVLKCSDFELRQCLFGEHLLTDITKPVAIVESEKTAIISSVYLPQFIWLAAGSLTNLNVEKCSVLAGQKVILFPDLNGYDKWTIKAKDLSDRILNTRFKVSDLLENAASEEERAKGLDLADYLERFDWKQFTADTQPWTPKPTTEPTPIKGDPATLAGIAQEETINWYNGHLLSSMQLSDSSYLDSISFDSG